MNERGKIERGSVSELVSEKWKTASILSGNGMKVPLRSDGMIVVCVVSLRLFSMVSVRNNYDKDSAPDTAYSDESIPKTIMSLLDQKTVRRSSMCELLNCLILTDKWHAWHCVGLVTFWPHGIQ